MCKSKQIYLVYLILRANTLIKICFSVLLEGGTFTKTLHVTARVEKPSVVFKEHNLYLGLVPINSKHEKILKVVSQSHETITWLIMEIFYCYKKKKFVEIDCSDHISVTHGEFNANEESLDIVYTFDTSKNMHWVSFLLLISSHPTITTMNSLCIVNYHVTTPKLKIHTIGSDFPIECPNHLLHKNIACLRKILLKSYCELTTSFIWGKPYGSQIENLDLKLSPLSGILQPQKG